MILFQLFVVKKKKVNILYKYTCIKYFMMQKELPNVKILFKLLI